MAACAVPAQQSGSSATPQQITIKLAENPWSGSQVNVAVAKKLLEEELGYTVEIVTIDENAQWAALANGDIHASLEVWPSGHAESIAQYIQEQQVVENAGTLGPVGEIGWFTPAYMIEQHPELATWEGFADPQLAQLYSTAETGDRGQFLAGDPSWVQYDEQIIRNLGLPLQVVYAGSEEAILAALDSAYSRQAPVLFYFYSPHSAFNRYELERVWLPDYSDECYAREAEEGIDCDYPSDQLFKIVWGGLSEAAPDAYQLLQNFNYTTADQIQMIAAVDSEGQSPEAAASAWIEANEDVWREWLP
jgi:glycine betaine/proline transport system substrate-binding protein